MSIRATWIALTLLAVGAPLGADESGYTFRPLIGHDGRTGLAELYGQPVLLSGFRRYIPDGLHAAWLADVMLRKHGDAGLVVVLREQQRWKGDAHGGQTRSFWVRFFISQPWLTYCADDKPRKGSFQARMQAAIKAEVRRRKAGWGETPAVKRVRATLFGKGELANAWKALERIPTNSVTPEVEQVRQEIRDRLRYARLAIERLLDAGHYLDAQAQLKALKKSTRGVDEFESVAAAFAERFKSEKVKSGLKADKSLAKLFRPLQKRKFKDLDAASIWKLRSIAKQHAGTPMGARAERLDTYFKSVYAAIRSIKFTAAEKRLRKER